MFFGSIEDFVRTNREDLILAVAGRDCGYARGFKPSAAPIEVLSYFMSISIAQLYLSLCEQVPPLCMSAGDKGVIWRIRGTSTDCAIVILPWAVSTSTTLRLIGILMLERRATWLVSSIIDRAGFQLPRPISAELRLEHYGLRHVSSRFVNFLEDAGFRYRSCVALDGHDRYRCSFEGSVR